MNYNKVKQLKKIIKLAKKVIELEKQPYSYTEIGTRKPIMYNTIEACMLDNPPITRYL